MPLSVVTQISPLSGLTERLKTDSEMRPSLRPYFRKEWSEESLPGITSKTPPSVHPDQRWPDGSRSRFLQETPENPSRVRYAFALSGWFARSWTYRRSEPSVVSQKLPKPST